MPAKTNRAQRRLIIAVMALYFIYSAVEADNEEPSLYVGDWTGFYRAGTVEWEEAKFFVKETGGLKGTPFLDNKLLPSQYALTPSSFSLMTQSDSSIPSS